MEVKNKQKKEPTGVEALGWFESALIIDRDSLDDALIEQPDLYYRVARRLSDAISNRDLAKFDVEKMTADVAKSVRKELSAGQNKATEAMVAEHVAREPALTSAQHDLLDAKRAVDRWQALLGSVEQRSHVLRELTSLYIAGYFGTKTSTARREALDRRTGQAGAVSRRADRD